MDGSTPSGEWQKSGNCGIEVVIAATVIDYNLRSACLLAGWDGVSIVSVKLTVNPGVIVGSSSPWSYALSIGPGLPAGSTAVLVNHGFVYGRGQGIRGGPALGASIPVNIENNGVIAGGGGGTNAGAAVVGVSNVTWTKTGTLVGRTD